MVFAIIAVEAIVLKDVLEHALARAKPHAKANVTLVLVTDGKIK